MTYQPNESKHCYHCGLALGKEKIPPLLILGEARNFCCLGCRSVSQLIVENGIEEYYQFRESQALYSSDEKGRKETNQRWHIYDEASFQRTFVKQIDSHIREAHLLLERIRCAACVWLNEQYLQNLNGILEVSVDYTSHQLRVRWDNDKIALSQILQAIESIGYQAHPFESSSREKLIAEEKRKSAGRLIFSAILSMEVMAHALATYKLGGMDEQGNLQLWEVIGRWTDLFVVTALMAYAGRDFFSSAWRDLKNHHIGMDVPIVIGLSAAYIGSFVATVNQNAHVYFDSIAMFLTLMLAARYFELKGRLLAAASFDRLLKITPQTAYKIDSQGQEQEVLVSDLAPDDLILIRPGQTIPVDGVLQEGRCYFNEAQLTGEVLPVVKNSGDTVYAGSCSIDQQLKVKVTKSVNHSTIQNIIQAMKEGLESRPQIAILADRIAKWFVLGLVVLATLTSLYWLSQDPSQALAITISVLMVTCPCALALATPVALSLSTGLLSEKGILPLDLSVIDRVSSADVIAFDKTGTLTTGKPQLDEIILTQKNSFSVEECLQVAATLEAGSEHPIAKAIQAEFIAKQSNKTNTAAFTLLTIKQKQKQNSPGHGIKGLINGKDWKIGTLEFIGLPAELSHSLKQRIKQARKQRKIVIALSCNGEIKCLLILSDPLRAQTHGVIDTLKQQGLKKVAIISGDHQDSVDAVGQLLGVDESHGGMKPADKLRWIQAQQAQGHRVIFVGDGINDAPVLAAADVSVSFSEATDLAQMNSHFIFITPSLSKLPFMINASKWAYHIIRQNFVWALVYNLLAIPLAAIGWIPPWGAALGMSISSFIVVLNAMRLKRLLREKTGTEFKGVLANGAI